MKRPAHGVTTAHLGAAHPFASDAGPLLPGVYIGRDLLGGAFAFDPFALYSAGVLTNPNMIVLGQIGRGKSSLVKTYLWRQAAAGRRAWVIDPKGEYSSLATAMGTRPLRLSCGGGQRLNPLEAPGGDETVSPSALLAALAEVSLGRPLRPRERAAADMAVQEAARRSGAADIPSVVEALFEPSAEAGRALRAAPSELAEDGRDLALELRRLVCGDLAGLFDGPTSTSIDLKGRLVVLDLSPLYGSTALGVLMTCALAWLQAQLRQGGQGQTVVVIDEAWAILSQLGVARWLQASWKLARAWGVSNVAVLHRPGDLLAAGTAESEQVRLAQGLLSDSETRVIYSQPSSEAEAARKLLGLSATEAELLPRLGRGIALWKLGSWSYLVRHRLGPGEAALVDTDSAMGGAAGAKIADAAALADAED